MIQWNILFSALKNKGFQFDEKKVLEDAKIFRKSYEDVLLEDGIVKEEELMKIKSEILNVPIKIFDKKEVISKEILNVIEESSARNYKLVVFDKQGNEVSVAMYHPDDEKALEAINFIAKQNQFKLKIFITTEGNLQKAWRFYNNFADNLTNVLKELQQKLAPQLKKFLEAQKVNEQTLDFKTIEKNFAEEAPIIKLLSIIVTEAVRIGASDIHFEPERKVLRVRFRADGNLYTSVLLPLEIHLPIISRIKIMANLKIDEMRMPQDGRFRSIIDEKPVDFRVSTFPINNGEKVAIRILDSSTGLFSISQLGLNEMSANVVKEAIKRPYGMFLITGPTGSGKTTTLYALLQILNNDGVNMVTLEDPVEYTIEGINQSQVLPEIGYTFSKGLRHIVRQDPDVIMVGEIRDNETAELAVHAALTGHLVLSTLHTNNAAGVIPRLVDLNVQKFLLPSSLNLMMAQRLVRKLCPYCKKERLASEEEIHFIEESIAGLGKELKDKFNVAKPYKIYDSVGCSECNNRGYKGRVGIFEVLAMNKAIEDIVLSDMSETKIKEEMRKQGMLSLREDGVVKVLNGVTTLTEIMNETDI